MQISRLTVKGQVLQSQLFLQLEGVAHYSSLKETQNAENDVWMPKQVHSTDIAELREQGDLFKTKEADAVICNIPGQWIGIRTADCVPILVYDPIQKVVAAIHAGWRGTVKHIATKTLLKMTEDFGCRATDLYAMIGPSISPEAFEVGDEVVAEFEKANRAECVIKKEILKIKSEKSDLKASPYSSLRTYNLSFVKSHIDLWQSNVMDLLDAGLKLDHIDCTPLCTFQHSDILYSARKEGSGTGRIITAIKIK